MQGISSADQGDNAGFCHRCGNCCEHIWFQHTHDEIIDRLQLYWDGLDDPDDAAWHDHYMKNITTLVFVLDNWWNTEPNRWECDAFDRIDRTCMAGMDRPAICQEYPWYGKTPGMETKNIGSTCGYWYDLPADERPSRVLPVLVAR